MSYRIRIDGNRNEVVKHIEDQQLNWDVRLDPREFTFPEVARYYALMRSYDIFKKEKLKIKAQKIKEKNLELFL